MYYLTTDDEDDMLNDFQYTLYKLDLCDYVTTLQICLDDYVALMLAYGVLARLNIIEWKDRSDILPGIMVGP